MTAPSRILFVCLGNICRSPAAEAILQSMAPDFHVESCGLGDWHKGSRPDPRMVKAAAKRGYTLNSRAFSFLPSFFDEYDLILAADRSVLDQLQEWMRSSDDAKKTHLITEWSEQYPKADIPDPYHGGEADFEVALDMLEEACARIAARWTC